MEYRNNNTFPDIISWKAKNASRDIRGFSYEPYRVSLLLYLSFPLYFQQELFSFSYKNVFRGMHYGTQGLGRLINVVSVVIQDIFVDLRKGSPTFGKWSYEVLAPEYMIYVPEYFAHGFYAFEDSTIIYHFTKPYSEKNHRILAYNDPQVGIQLPAHANPIISDRDNNGTLLKDLDFYF